MDQIIYTIEAVTKHNGQCHFVEQTTNEKRASKIADKVSTDNPKCLVFVSWYRESDHQQGYLNRSGHDIVGRSW